MKNSLHLKNLAVATWLAIAGSISLHAQTNWCPIGYAFPPPPPPPSDPPSTVCEPTECCKCNKSPNFVASGVYEDSAVDLSISTPAGHIAMVRRYSSGNYSDGLLGPGWKAGFAPRIHLTSHKVEYVQITDAPGPPLYQYRTTQYLAVLTSPEGAQHHFLGTYRTQHLLVEQVSDSFTAPLGRYDQLVRNADGTYQFTFQRSRAKATFRSDGLISTATDEFGNSLNYSYDGSARLTQIADQSGSGRSITFYYGANGRISSVQDSGLRQVLYGYDAAGMLTSVTDPAGRVTTYVYETGMYAKRLVQVKDHWNRVITDVSWTAHAKVNSYSEAGETFTYTYKDTETEKRDSAGNMWLFPFQADGLVTADGPPGIGTFWGKQTTFNADGSIAGVRDEDLVRTDYTYGANGAVASVTRSAPYSPSNRFDYGYDPNFPEKVISVLPKNPANGANDPDWQGWKYDYYPTGSNAPGALHHVYRVRNDGVTTDTVATYTYDIKGRVLSVTDAAGGVTDYAYDAAGNLSTVTAPTNNDVATRPVTTYGYDSLGRVTSVTDPLANVTAYAYDALDRITTVTLPKPVVGSPLNFVTTYSYDNYDAGTGLTFTHVTDPNGQITKQGYDQFGRLRKSIDALTNPTTYGYTTDLLTSITDANNNVTSYEYNVRKLLSATVFPDGARETYTYYRSGLLNTKTDRKNQTITYEYDLNRRLTKKIYPNSTYIQYTYTGQKLTQVYDNSVSPAETHTFSYDSSFRVSSNTQGPRGTIGYTYTPADAVATMSVTGGPTTTYSYYPDGSLNTIVWSPVTGQFKYNYRLNGQYSTITFPNSQTRNFTYDNQGRLTQISNLHPTAGNLATYDYAYDLNHATAAYTMLGQRVSMTANVPSQSFVSALHKYYYDASYQLTRVDYPAAAPFNGEVHSWTYDAIGNRLTSTVNGTTTNYTYQKIGTNPNNWNRLSSDGVNSHSYDAAGNVSTIGSLSSTWNYENRMTKIEGAATNDYGYDYQGRRSHKVNAGQTVSFLYEGIQPIAISSVTTQNVLMGVGVDELLGTFKNGGVEYPLIDDLGSFIGAARTDGSTVDNLVHDAWGKIRSQQGAVPPAFGYTGREIGEEALMYYRFRYYSPGTGRFMSEDPLQEYVPVIGGAVYGYVNNSPLLFNDPMGLKCTQKLFQGEKKVHHEIGEKWELTGSLQYPDLNPLNAPLKGLLKVLKWKKVKKGLFVYGETTIECFWTKFFYSTHYWKQDYSLKVVCECPSDSWEYKGSNSGEIKTKKIVVDHAKTFGSLGVTYEPCPKPTW